MKQRRVVDLNDRRTWPKLFQALVEEAAPSYDEDRWFDPSKEKEAIAALDECLVRAYHCTRLTDRELRSVLSDGLLVLSPELAARRLEAAVTDRHLTPEEGALYSRTKLPRDPGRRGMVWFFTDRASLSDAHQIGYLVEGWGGEGINMAWNSRSPEYKRLETVGSPSVVIASLDLRIHCERASPGILDAAVQYLVSGTGGTTIQSLKPVEPDYIESVEQAGSSYWNKYVWTPRQGFKFT